MGERRRPIMTILLKKQGKKTNKVELFKATDFVTLGCIGYNKNPENCYRLRVNGKWFPKGEKRFLWKSEIRNLLFRSLKIK